VFADWADQRLHRVDPGGEPVPISPEPPTARGHRWSEPTWLDDRWLVCVRERHDPDVVAEHGEAVDEPVAIAVDELIDVLTIAPEDVRPWSARSDAHRVIAGVAMIEGVIVAVVRPEAFAAACGLAAQGVRRDAGVAA